eukprot:CAMPEP_0184481594 /NCGR_PEP_ID=MMETSP0113_2-20130426/3150_1 /TAXON_ID=91329 /ORGANISM="Norrisiella sphaerica, Strain BC52" /LENGTH=145 /DNA_ID=CAMNT_0026860809 /DNA_START=229 /DNA_END=666 /DNA_ORIENTATION=+
MLGRSALRLRQRGLGKSGAYSNSITLRSTPLQQPLFCAKRSTLIHAQSVKDEILKAVNDNQVMIYSKSYCPFCVKVKDLFTNQLGVTPTVIELDEQPTDELESTLKELTQQRTVPQVFVNGEFIGGCDDTMRAANSGKLQEFMSK